MIDIRSSITDKAAGLHWQVAQATSLTNVNIYASTTANNTQMGLFTENGSGGFMSDCFISGGAYGLCKFLMRKLIATPIVSVY
jgi:glucan 1,3-beta-glucosidase